jgi:hypothetical protein
MGVRSLRPDGVIRTAPQRPAAMRPIETAPAFNQPVNIGGPSVLNKPAKPKGGRKKKKTKTKK